MKVSSRISRSLVLRTCSTSSPLICSGTALVLFFLKFTIFLCLLGLPLVFPQVQCFELTRSRPPQRRLWEVQSPGPVQWLGMVRDRICVGFPGGFALLALQGESSPVSLVWPQDPSLVFLSQQPLDALHAVEVGPDQILLCFSQTGIYVDNQGRRTRTSETMWPGTPLAFSKSRKDQV